MLFLFLVPISSSHFCHPVLLLNHNPSGRTSENKKMTRKIHFADFCSISSRIFAMQRRSLLLIALLFLSSSSLLSSLLYATADDATTTSPRRPNIVLLITDDQDVLLGGVEHMPILQRQVVARGISFRHAFVHTPICCPSRSSILVRGGDKK